MPQHHHLPLVFLAMALSTSLAFHMAQRNCKLLLQKLPNLRHRVCEASQELCIGD